MQEIEYGADPGPFVGCPGDVERFFGIVERIFSGLIVPGGRRDLYHWKKSHDPGASGGAEGDQYRIQQTSAAETSPVFILLGNTVGTPVRAPREGWGEMRAWLDANGYGFVALLGEPGFEDMHTVPAGKVPMSGTLFELFDAFRSETETQLDIFDLHKLCDAPDDPPQSEWSRRICESVERSKRLFTPESIEEFEAMVLGQLKRAFGVGRLDPRIDPPPGLEAISADAPLLFGRESEVEDLGKRIFDFAAPLTLVTGISGTGKSSLLRAGLMGEGFRQVPQGKGVRRRARGFLIEPDLLAQSVDADPLEALGRMLAGAAVPERAVGPLPEPLALTVPSLPPATGDLETDLGPVLDWWEQVAAALPGSLVLVLDQAEQIDAAARRAAEDLAGPTGEAVSPALDPAWWRLTGLLAALTGVLEPSLIPEALQSRVKALATQKRLRLVLSLHRMSALELWPLAASHADTVFDVKPLTEWRRVIEGTLMAYGLEPAPELLLAMAEEATSLADARQEVEAPEEASDKIRPGQVSVLPQLVTALGRLIMEWTRRHGADPAPDREAMVLDLPGYAPYAAVHGATEALGEEAWAAWQATVAQGSGLDRSGYFSARRLEEEQARRFGQLFARLVDPQLSRTKLREDLVYLRKDHPVAQARAELVAALRKHRLLTSSDTDYLRLPHRSILDNWGRAQAWRAGVEARLAAKARLRALHDLDSAAAGWSEADIEAFAELVLAWIGTGEGEDGDLLSWAQGGLLARLEPDRVAVDGERALDRLPLTALASGERDFAAALLDKAAQCPSLAVRGSILIALAEQGETEMVAALLGGSADAQALTGFAHDGVFPLLIAAQNGHLGVVTSLLTAGSDPNVAHEKTGAFPLLMAAERGHSGVVERLLAAGANPSAVRGQTGASPLRMAAQNGYGEVVESLIVAGADLNAANPNDGTFPLLMAAQQGHSGVVHSLLAAGAEPNVTHQNGGFPLLLAAEEGHSDVVEHLLAAGAKPNKVNDQTRAFPLLQAAQNGHGDVVECLLAAGVDPNAINGQTGTFPLLLAAQEGHGAVVKSLLSAGADPSAVNPTNGAFPLLLAAQNGHGDVVECLLAAGVDPNAINGQTGTFPLLMASQNGHSGVVHSLLGAGAEPNASHEDKAFPLLLAAAEGHSGVVERLLAAGVDPNTVAPKYGYFPLLVAAEKGHSGVVESLLVAGATPNAINFKDGGFPLLGAAHYGHPAVVERLLVAGANVNAANSKDGAFPLLQASQYGHPAVVERLLAAGADPNAINGQIRTFPLVMAAQNGHGAVVESLLAAGAEPDATHENGAFPLLLAAEEGHSGVVESLLAAGADPNVINGQIGTFPLLMAARNGHSAAVESLLAAGADPNAVNDHTRNFPLLVAAQNGHDAVVESLLAAGAEPNSVNDRTGTFALAMAAQQGHPGVVERLIAAGADPNTVDPKYNNFPLLVAVAKGHVGVVESLLVTGADPNMVNPKDGTFPLLVAAQQGHPGVVERLLAAGAEPDSADPKDGAFPLLMAASLGHTDIVALLLDASTAVDQRHRQSGLTPLGAATMAGHWSICEALLGSGANPDLLLPEFQQELTDRLRPSIGDKSTLAPASPRARQHLGPAIGLSTPFTWSRLDGVEESMAREFEYVLHKAAIPLEALRRIVGRWSAEAIGLGNLRLCCAQFVLGSQQGDCAFELVWLPACRGLHPVALHLGLPISGVLQDYRAAGLMIDMRLEKAREAFAALAFFCRGSFPLADEVPIPLPDGAKLRTAWSGDAWRTWKSGTGPNGAYVEFPWIEGDRLLRGKILVPATGFEMQIAERVDTIAIGENWTIPPWTALVEGKPAMLRFVGQAG